MPYSVSLKPGAESDAEQAYNWYEEQRTRLGEEFLSELENIYAKLETLPTAYGKLTRIYRRASLKRFPYIVIFEIRRQEVIVYAVFHTSRKPRLKFNRRK
jgi:plasmid stabilization system protein ParE